MESIKRAFLYVTRKRGKSILLLIILLLMATFVLTGLSIEKAARITQEKLRYALSGEFEIVPDFSENNPYYKMETDEDGNLSLYTERLITQEIIETVMDTSGIKSYNGMSQYLVSTELDVIPGNVPVKDKFRYQVYARFVTGTESNSFFRDETLKLTEGSHLPLEGGHVAVISEDLAEKNGLQIGDSLSLFSENGGHTEIKIIGLFEVAKQVQALTSVTSYDKLENQIFSGIQAYQDLMPNITAGFSSAVFQVHDPAKLDEIVSQVKKNDSIDWRAFKVETNNQTYQAAAAPLEKFQSLITTVLILIIAVSAIILSLILAMWAKTRIHETGILLSIGFGKGAIISQYLAEVLIIAVIAFGLSFFSSNLVASQIGSELLKTQMQSTKDTADVQTENGLQVTIKDNGISDDYMTDIKGNGGEAPSQKALSEPLSVNIGFDNMAELYLIGFAIIILSVGVASSSVMRLKPQEILSKMS